MLSARTLLRHDGVEIVDVACRHTRGRGHAGEQTGGHAVVFVRRGCFLRSADGVETLLDPTLAYCMNPGEEQRYDHPHDHGDDCTSIFLTPDLVASLWGGEEALPTVALGISPEIDLEHRLLLSAGHRGEDQYEILERAIPLTAQVLEEADPRRIAAGRPVGTRARRR